MKHQARHERIDSKPANKHTKPPSSQKRGSAPKLPLEEIVGFTVANRNGLASNTSTSYCVYIAGCVAVAYDFVSGSQLHFVAKHRPPKPLSCVAVSLDGRLVAAGEGGHQPTVLVWDIVAKTHIAELKAHNYGVTCVAFSPNSKLLASSGCSRDGYICLWDLHHKKLITRVKESSPCILSLTFSADAKYIVTAGNDHLKLWTITPLPQPHSKAKVVSFSLHGKPVNLNGLKGGCFVSVASTNWSNERVTPSSEKSPPIFALADSGEAYEPACVEKSFGLSISSKMIACACNAGIVMLFDCKTLTHSRNLYFSDSTRCNDVRSTSYDKEANEDDIQVVYRDPDALACQFLSSEKLVVIYSDHSLYIWDIHDTKTATRCCVLVAHSACIMDIQPLPCDHLHDPSSSCIARGCSEGVSFASCSADGIIRLWDLIYQPPCLDDASKKQTQVYASDTNLFSSTHLVSSGIFERDIDEPGTSGQGFLSMAVTSDGKYLAAGDCKGNLHIYDLCTSDFVCLQDAHNAEIMCLSFSSPSKVTALSEEAPRHHYLLASGGRDRAIHIFDVKRNFHPVANIKDHGAVTSVKLSSDGCKILSCTADGCLTLWDIVIAENGFHAGRCHRFTTSDGIVCDMDADLNMEIAVTVGRDLKIRMFNLTDGKLSSSFRQIEDFGDPISISMDQSLSYVLCSYSNKSICLYDLSMGQMVAQASGHGQVVTKAIFLPDCGRIISVGGDNCMFVWKIPRSIASKMLQNTMGKDELVSPQRKMQLAALDQLMVQREDNHDFTADTKDTSVPENLNKAGQRILFDGENPHSDPAFNFSVLRLPKWARAKVTSSDLATGSDTASSSLDDDQKYTSPGIFNGGLSDAQNSHECDSQECHTLSCAKDTQDCLDLVPKTLAGSQEDSPDSPIAEESHSFSWNKDKCWHRIHTVCLDLLSSPEIYGVAAEKTAIVNLTETLTSGDQNPTSKNFTQTTHLPPEYSEQGDDLFKEFGYSSEKLQLHGKESPIKRRYSARFSLRRDHAQVFKKPIQVQDTGIVMFNHGDSSRAQTTSKDMPIEEPRSLELEKIPSGPKPKLAGDSCTSTFSLQNSPEIVEEANRKRANTNTPSEDRGGMENIFECKEALINLENAAKAAWESFFKLRQTSSASNHQLCSEAEEVMPLITEQVERLRKLVNFTTSQAGQSDEEGTLKKQKL